METVSPGGPDGKESTCNAEDPLENEIATHSSFLAWEIPWTEEPDWLQSMGSQRVEYDLATKQQQHIYTTMCKIDS